MVAVAIASNALAPVVMSLRVESGSSLSDEVATTSWR